MRGAYKPGMPAHGGRRRSRARRARADGPGPRGRPTRLRAADRGDRVGAGVARRRGSGQRPGGALAPGGQLAAACHYSYELRLHRARGYGALKAILDVLAETEPLTLTEIALRLRRTPGSTKDYLSWLEDVDLIVARQKRYSFADPLLRLWVRLYCRPAPPTDEEVAAGSAQLRARRVCRRPSRRWRWPARRRRPIAQAWGIIEID